MAYCFDERAQDNCSSHRVNILLGMHIKFKNSDISLTLPLSKHTKLGHMSIRRSSKETRGSYIRKGLIKTNNPSGF